MAYTPYQMKGPALYKPPVHKDVKKTKKKKKTVEDYLNEGFSQAEAEQMAKDGATTGTSPAAFLGGMLGKVAKGVGKFAKGVVTGKDGKFGIGDVGRLALGPVGAVAGGAGLFKKGKKPINFNSTMDLNEDRYGPSAGETVAMNKFKFTKNNKKSKTKNY